MKYLIALIMVRMSIATNAVAGQLEYDLEVNGWYARSVHITSRSSSRHLMALLLTQLMSISVAGDRTTR